MSENRGQWDPKWAVVDIYLSNPPDEMDEAELQLQVRERLRERLGKGLRRIWIRIETAPIETRSPGGEGSPGGAPAGAGP